MTLLIPASLAGKFWWRPVWTFSHPLSSQNRHSPGHCQKYLSGFGPHVSVFGFI